jgi:non-ribosomal peptide synthetase-like protein
VFSLLAAEALLAVVTVLFFAWLERASLGFKWLTPKVVSIYDPYFWAHERHWKLSDSPIVQMFKGTPFKNVVSRLVGVKMGRKVYDDGCITTERTLTHVGDYANLNEGSVIQPHSLEEGVFKSDHIQIGKGCTLGVGAFVHYGVAMHEQAVLDADSFLMKGEVLDPHSVWRGNPAKPICRRQVQDRFEAKLIDRLVKDEATSSLEPADAFVPKEAVE